MDEGGPARSDGSETGASEPSDVPEPGGDATEDRPGMSLEDLAGSLAAFHVATLVAIAILAGHLAGILGDALGGLDTLVGIGLYFLLWGIVHVTVDRWLAGAGTWPVDPVSLVGRAAAWGAVTGTGFLWALLTLFLASRVLAEGPGEFSFRFAVLAVSIGYVVGGAVAGAVGAAVATVFGSVDYALIALAVRVGGADGRRPDSSG